MSESVAQPEAGQDPTATPAVPEQAAPAAQDLTGPWAKDLEAVFADETVRTQVNDFLAGKVQPYVTGLETQVKGLEPASELLADLQSDPGSTFLALSEELYGEAGAAAVREALINSNESTPPADPAAPTTPASETPLPAELQELLPAVKQIVQRSQEEDDAKAYHADVAALVEKDSSVVPEDFAPFVVAAEGDIAVAYQGYKQWLGRVAERFGVKLDPEEVPAELPAAPQALGSDGETPAPPPVQKQYGSLDDAMDDFFAEQKAAAPPPVGAT